MRDEIFDRAEERIRSLGLSDDATERKLAQYAALREDKPRGLSSLDVVNVAEDLMTSFTWVVVGERDPFELRSTAQNVLCGPENDEPGAEWLLAKNVFSDIVTAYQQVSLGPSDNFKWTEPRNIEYAAEKLRELGSKNKKMYFFDIIEECFGVDIVVLDRPEQFTAIGATIGGAPLTVDRRGVDTVVGNSAGTPLIVVKQGLDNMVGNYAVARELGHIMAGRLYWYSDVYKGGEDPASRSLSDAWIADFSKNLVKFVWEEVELMDDACARQRFPKRLIEAHRRDVAAKKNLGYFLEWMEK